VPVKVTVCVGSSCHIRGSRAVLERFAEIVQAEHLQEEVSLVGAFCMERCGECVNWKFDEEQISSANLLDAETTLRRRLAERDQDDIIL
jgi:NADH:ubiquinone oxidoreductase subunit E